jgi:hypothetical protein
VNKYVIEKLQGTMRTGERAVIETSGGNMVGGAVGGSDSSKKVESVRGAGFR